jgi:hypothetical protein
LRTAEWGGELVMPAEIALALGGPAYTAPFDPWHRPSLGRRRTRRRRRERPRRPAQRWSDWSATCSTRPGAPVPTLRTGGIGLRELRRAAKSLGCAEPGVRLAASIAAYAGLLRSPTAKAPRRPPTRRPLFMSECPADAAGV